MATVAKPAVLCVGRLYCDLIFTDVPRLPTLGTEVFANGFGAHAGGGAFITAAHLAALGHASGLAALLPSPPFADLLRADLEAAQVDLSLCTTLPKKAGPQITVAMVTGGDRAFLTRRAGMALPSLAGADVARRGYTHLHIGELASLREHPEVLSLAREQGMTVSLDCGWEDGLRGEELGALISQVDVFLPNEAEWNALQQTGLHARVAPLTVVKRGSLGAQALAGPKVLDAPTRPLETVDTTGAGDAFNAGFLSHWLAGVDLSTCLAAGNARGAFAVQCRGGFTARAAHDQDLDVPVK